MATASRVSINVSQAGINGAVSEQADRKFTIMIIFMFIIYFVGNIPVAFAIIYTYVESSPPALFFQTFIIIANLLDVLSHGTYFFVYYNFNILFKNTFHSFLKKVVSFLW